jgi:hypothetical protein
MRPREGLRIADDGDLPVFEIDLSRYRRGIPELTAEFSRYILVDAPRWWVFHPRWADAIDKVKCHLVAREDEAERQRLIAEAEALGAKLDARNELLRRIKWEQSNAIARALARREAMRKPALELAALRLRPRRKVLSGSNG